MSMIVKGVVVLAVLGLGAVCVTGGQPTQGSRQAAWRLGPPFGPGYFPLAVWLQSPATAARYKEAGINLYVGLWQGPTEQQLGDLRKAGMPVICDQNAVGLAHRDDPTIVGWMHGDEPDNAQPVRDPATGKEGYGPCIPPRRIVDDYEKLRRTDPTRPVLLNLGQGVANDEWIGRGSGAKLSDYETYVLGGDIISFDVYPVAGLEKPKSEDYLWYVAKGVERLARWTGGQKRIWNCLECTRISNGRVRATPAQVRAEAWMAIVHGSRGFIYFVHEFKPRFNEHALLDDPEMLRGVTELNAEVTRLAPVINSPDVAGGVTVSSAPSAVPVAAAAKRHGGATYVFSVGMRNSSAQAEFAVQGHRGSGRAEVLGEERTVAVRDGKFADSFGPYQVHLYRLR